jgi:hypothetical protein
LTQSVDDAVGLWRPGISDQCYAHAASSLFRVTIA